MGELAARAEVIKLAHELSTEPQTLEFLQSADEDDLAELRRAVSRGLFAAHEPRLRRIAGLSKLLPPALTARIAEAALSPMLCGRIAGVLDTDAAVRLAGHLRPAFLAEVSRSIDAARTADIVRHLPDALVLAVAQLLLDQGEYIVLGRFVAVVDEDIARRVIEMASGVQLLQASFYAEDRARLDALLTHVDDTRLTELVRAAADGGQLDEAVSMLTFLGPQSQRRLSTVLIDLGPEVADGVVAAIVELEAWSELLPVVGALDTETIALLVNVPTTMDPAVIAALIAQVRDQPELIAGAKELGYFALIVSVIDALDDAHRAVLSDIKELDDPDLRAWAASVAGVSLAVADATVAAFRSGGPLPEELVRALELAGPSSARRG